MTAHIREAKEEDIPALTDIYNYHIDNGHSTFQEKSITVELMFNGFKQYKSTGPYRMLVAEVDGKVVGRASSFKYREGDVFQRTVETGIYLDPSVIGKGIGAQLYRSLFDILAQEQLHLAVVGIALPNNASIALHKKFDFKEVGVFDEYAFVNGKYYSSIWMQKRLNEFSN